MRTIHGYEIREELGRGGMGVVYRAFDPRARREVALKVLTRGAAALPEQRARFAVEARALASFQHPNVVRIHAAGEDQGSPYLVTDLIEGTSLEARLTRGPLPPEEAVALLEQLAAGMAASHAVGILHRDLKPANVLLRAESGTPVLIDFGLAKSWESGEAGPTRSGAALGTPGYWAPEQAQGASAAVSPRTDVYGLGAILYAALTGDPPVKGGSMVEIVVATLTRPVLAPSAAGARSDRGLDEICLRCLAKDPEARFASAFELGAALASWRRGHYVPQRRHSRGPLALVSASLAAAVVLLLLGLLRFGSPWAADPGAVAEASRGAASSPSDSIPGASPTGTARVAAREAPLWVPLPAELRALRPAEASLAEARRGVRFAVLAQRVPALKVVARGVRTSRLDHLPSGDLYVPHSTNFARHGNPSAAQRSNFLGALRGNPRACAESAANLLRPLPSAVHDPVFAERYLLELTGEGLGFVPANLGWAYAQGSVGGLDLERSRELQAACFVVADALGEERISAPLARLREQGSLPDAAAGWELLRARALELEALPLAPAWWRRPPLPLDAESARALAWETLGELSSRSPTLLVLQGRAPDESDAGKFAADLHAALSGEAAAVRRVGARLAGDRLGDPDQRAIGRLLLLTAARLGDARAFLELERVFDLAGEAEARAACQIAARSLAASESVSSLAVEPEPAELAAWRALWRASESDRASLGLDASGPSAARRPFPLPSPQGEILDLPVSAQRWETALACLLSRSPEMRFLAREGTLAGYAELDSGTFNEFTVWREARPIDYVAASLLRGSSRLDFALMDLGRDTTGSFSDEALVLARYAAASGFAKRSYFSLYGRFERERNPSLMRAALNAGIAAREAEAQLFAQAAASEVTKPQPPAEALDLLRADLAQRWAAPAASGLALEIAPRAPLTDQELPRQVRAFALSLLVRHSGLAAEYAAIPPQLTPAEVRQRCREADKEREGSGAPQLLRVLVQEGRVGELSRLSYSLIKLGDPSLEALAWACLHREAELTRAREGWSVLAAAYGRAGRLKLGACALALAEGEGTGIGEAKLYLRDMSLPARAQALEQIAVDRARTYMAAGYPWVE